MYRNNPRYSNFSENSSEYIKNLNNATKNLKQRLLDTQLDKRSQEKAQLLAKQREEERKFQAMQEQIQSKNALFHQLLSTTFNNWITQLWRKASPYILKEEMVKINILIFVNS